MLHCYFWDTSTLQQRTLVQRWVCSAGSHRDAYVEYDVMTLTLQIYGAKTNHILLQQAAMLKEKAALSNEAERCVSLSLALPPSTTPTCTHARTHARTPSRHALLISFRILVLFSRCMCARSVYVYCAYTALVLNTCICRRARARTVHLSAACGAPHQCP